MLWRATKEYQRANQARWRARHNPGREEIRVCKGCTKEFRVWVGQGIGWSHGGRSYCTLRCRQKAQRLRKPIQRYQNYIKTDRCASCGFVALHPVQLDVDHINGDHLNNTPGNHQTLCANCHRLKSILNKDGIHANY